MNSILYQVVSNIKLRTLTLLSNISVYLSVYIKIVESQISIIGSLSDFKKLNLQNFHTTKLGKNMTFYEGVASTFIGDSFPLNNVSQENNQTRVELKP